MLSTFLPRLSGTSLNSILATQAFCSHFLPLSHPQYYLAAIFKLWEAFHSGIWDEQWLDTVERLAVKHLDPGESDPKVVVELREKARERGEFVDGEEGGRVEDMLADEAVEGDVEMDGQEEGQEGEWQGIRKDVGIFTEQQFAFIMTKCLRAMGAFSVSLSLSSAHAPRDLDADPILSSSLRKRRCPRRRRNQSRRGRCRRLRFRHFGRGSHRGRLDDEATHRETRILRRPHRLLHVGGRTRRNGQWGCDSCRR